MKKQDELRLDVEESQAPAYKTTKKHISWTFKRGVIKMTIESLDRIFYEYSKHGLNMTQVQVQNKHGLTAIEWQSMKRTFDLVKDSDVFSPYTLSLYSGKEQCDMIAEKIAEKYNPKNMREVIAYEHNKQRGKAYEKAIKDASNLDYRRHQFEDGILEYVTRAKVAPLVRKSKDVILQRGIAAIGDIHFGAEIEAELNLPAFNPKIIADRLKSIAIDINSKKVKNLTLIIGGDLIETFTGLSHINSWKNINKKEGYGVKAVIGVTDLLATFISNINNIKEVKILSGNHDRVTSNNKEDVEGEVVRWVHYVLNARFGKLMKFEWSKDVISFKMDKCGFIVSHGHLSLCKKNPDHLINQYGFAGMFNLVLLFHLHTRKILVDNWNSRIIHLSSIFTGNDYAKNLGYSSLPGYTFINVQKGLPVVTDIPIK